MPFDLHILSDKVEKIKESFQNGNFADALVASLNTGSGLMQQRIFQANQDVEGNSFGGYIGRKRKARLQFSPNRTQNKRNKNVAGQDLTSYQRKRAKLGRQISHKDLELTGGLRLAIETQLAEKETDHSAVLKFSTDDVAMIAHGQESQITNIRNGSRGTTKGKGIKIFGFNTDELEQVIEQGQELINEILK